MAMLPIALGQSIPANTAHAVSVSLPTWKANVGYEKAEEWVVNRMTTGYPRFFIHKLITAFSEDIVKKYGGFGEQAILFPSRKAAERCENFIKQKDTSLETTRIKIVDFLLDYNQVNSEILRELRPSISAVLLPRDSFSIGKQYWQHSGDGISSRRAEFCHGLFLDGVLVEASLVSKPEGQRMCRGPRRYQRAASMEKSPGSADRNEKKPSKSLADPLATSSSESRESSQFVEERFGRNLEISFVNNAKAAMRRRIAGSLAGDADLTSRLSSSTHSSMRGVHNLSEDVYLYSCGMNAIFNAHQIMLEAREPMDSIMFGFPYVDTLKILENFGPGCLFYGRGTAEDLDDLERRLKSGERYLALFCEFPGNPLLASPNLARIKSISEAYDFAVIVDETIGNFVNVHVLPYSDVVVSSLTKVFAGECNVMGGCAIINPNGRYYQMIKDVVTKNYEDNYWAEDVIFMERNSRDFMSRIERINRNAEGICDILQANALVKTVYYPKVVPSRLYYDFCRTADGGYGGLLSVTFHRKDQAIAFFDQIHTAKGPSLGTNFTLTSPYVVLAHYHELEWAARFGVESDLIRISVGLEDMEILKIIFSEALKAAESSSITT